MLTLLRARYRTISPVHRLFSFSQRLCRGVGISLEVVGRIPRDLRDRDLYRPRFQPWMSDVWRKRLRLDDPRSLVSAERKYMLYMMLTQALEGCEGSVAECGVYRGGTARMFAEMLAGTERALHLFDTFSGMPETDPTLDFHRRGDFSDTNASDVADYLSPFPFVRLHVGFIPETFGDVSGERFSFVHIDLDIHDAIKSATEFFYDRLEPGGVIIYDDYGFPSCPGARVAVDDFFAPKREAPIVLSNGQAFIIKLGEALHGVGRSGDVANP